MPSATTEQILEAFEALSDEEMIALRKVARRHLGGTPYSEPLDLIYEALSRALHGRRNWPLGLDFGLFMAMTMKSIANGERQRVENNPAAMRDWEVVEDELARLAPSPEELGMQTQKVDLARELARRAKSELKGDTHATRVLDGMMAGMTPSEMREGFGMAAQAFDSARHRVMRQLRQARLH